MSIVFICIIGIVINFVILGCAAAKEPNGAMGMGPMLLLAFIPFLFAILYPLSWLGDKWGW